MVPKQTIHEPAVLGIDIPVVASEEVLAQRQPTRIHIFLVDKHTLVRAGLRLLLDQERALQVVGEAGTGRDALTGVAETQPDVVLLELDLDLDDGLEVLSDLLTVAPRSRIIILTGIRDSDLHQRAVQRGAMGVVLKGQAPADLVQAICKVYAGEVWLDDQVMARLLRPAPVKPKPVLHARLDDRERAVVALLCEGLHNKQIATHLHIAEVTVRHRLTDIYRSLGVASRLELVVFAFRHGLCRPD